ncbi:acVLRF1 family peptidyl-tRNA hydrolase [Allorhizocola rhizosphaerae]|uniref:acVLRF1 family peptidyl-tRNA hydrolase n=1 Tax=Allorhizocola rhizosphaerae TaxID=1872709 RepID=UPI000E3D54E8|nr:acVLRF1 family peptidyl-tRNA hydrolase [Allorhizocola rhizosphaerae]
MRWVDISPHRLAGWLDGFYQRHDGATEEGLLLRAANGDTALLFPPPGSPTVTTVDQLLASLKLEKRLGLLLARRGACAVGVSVGGKLEASKVERFYQQGRTAAGGWSQQRFARRRANQTEAGVREAAEIAARVLLPAAGDMDAFVCGGDRGIIEQILADPRLAPLLAKRYERVYEVPEPRHAVLLQAVADAAKVRIRLEP